MDERDRYREALKAIAGPSDSGPFIAAYREAGGGYEGLQAIAREALRCPVCNGEGTTLYHGCGAHAQIRSCSACGTGEKIADSAIANTASEPDPS